MSRPAPALLPLFRSEQQLRLLGVLFAGSDGELPLGDLAIRAGVAQATASREVARLAAHGLVVVRSLGRNSLVAANWALPWARELRSILVQTVGVLGHLSEALADVVGIEEAFVFGSWAARYVGEVGPPPRDVDVVVVGDVPLTDVREACAAVEAESHVEVNPVVVPADDWSSPSPDPFVEGIRSRPLVAIPLRPAA